MRRSDPGQRQILSEVRRGHRPDLRKGESLFAEYDAWRARYDAAGSQAWIEQFGTPANDGFYALAPDGAGGLFGVALGIAIPVLVTWFAAMKTIITFWSPLLAFTISGLVGVVFGIYPALRAAQMDPVEALRAE